MILLEKGRWFRMPSLKKTTVGERSITTLRLIGFNIVFFNRKARDLLTECYSYTMRTDKSQIQRLESKAAIDASEELKRVWEILEEARVRHSEIIQNRDSTIANLKRENNTLKGAMQILKEGADHE